MQMFIYCAVVIFIIVCVYAMGSAGYFGRSFGYYTSRILTRGTHGGHCDILNHMLDMIETDERYYTASLINPNQCDEYVDILNISTKYITSDFISITNNDTNVKALVCVHPSYGILYGQVLYNTRNSCKNYKEVLPAIILSTKKTIDIKTHRRLQKLYKSLVG